MNRGAWAVGRQAAACTTVGGCCGKAANTVLWTTLLMALLGDMLTLLKEPDQGVRLRILPTLGPVPLSSLTSQRIRM